MSKVKVTITAEDFQVLRELASSRGVDVGAAFREAIAQARSSLGGDPEDHFAAERAEVRERTAEMIAAMANDPRQAAGAQSEEEAKAIRKEANKVLSAEGEDTDDEDRAQRDRTNPLKKWASSGRAK